MADAGGYEKINIFNLGEKGVVNAKDPIHVIDGELLQSQNAIANNPDEGLGGLEKRGGMTKLNTVALGGSVLGVVNVPLEDPISGFGEWIYGPYKGGGTQHFAAGGSYDFWVASGPILLSTTDHAPGLEGNGNNGNGTRQYGSKLSAAFPASTDYRTNTMGRIGNQLFYATDFYTQDTDAPPIFGFNGIKEFEVARIPEWFDAGTRRHAKAIIRIVAIDGYLYATTWDGGSGANLQGRVFRLDPSTGTLLQIGEAFGNAAGELAGGMPFAICGWNGRVWVGTANGEAAPVGKVYWIRPGIDTAWTLDHTTAASQGNILALSGYTGTGNLYAGTDGVGGANAALVLQRTPSGVWSTSDTGGKVVTRNRFDILVEHAGELYAHYYTPSGAPAANEWIVRKYDGTSWTTDADFVSIMTAASLAPANTESGGSALSITDLLIIATGMDPATLAGQFFDKRAGVWRLVPGSALGAGDVPLGYIRSDDILNLGHL